MYGHVGYTSLVEVTYLIQLGELRPNLRNLGPECPTVLKNPGENPDTELQGCSTWQCFGIHDVRFLYFFKDYSLKKKKKKKFKQKQFLG